jgi:predicted permease
LPSPPSAFWSVAGQSPTSPANKLNMDVFVPALVFGALANKSFHITEFLPLLVATLAVVIGSGFLGLAVARGLGIAPKTLVPPMMFNNCGNLGCPWPCWPSASRPWRRRW